MIFNDLDIKGSSYRHSMDRLKNLSLCYDIGKEGFGLIVTKSLCYHHLVTMFDNLPDGF